MTFLAYRYSKLLCRHYSGLPALVVRSKLHNELASLDQYHPLSVFSILQKIKVPLDLIEQLIDPLKMDTATVDIVKNWVGPTLK